MISDRIVLEGLCEAKIEDNDDDRSKRIVWFFRFKPSWISAFRRIDKTPYEYLQGCFDLKVRRKEGEPYDRTSCWLYYCLRFIDNDGNEESSDCFGRMVRCEIGGYIDGYVEFFKPKSRGSASFLLKINKMYLFSCVPQRYIRRKGFL